MSLPARRSSSDHELGSASALVYMRDSLGGNPNSMSEPMDVQVRASYDAARDLSGQPFPSACYAPFVSLYFNTVGNVVACCRNQSYALGNVTRERLGDIWRGPRIRAMRASLAAYRFPPGCEFCEWMIKAGDHQGAMAHHFDQYTPDSSEPPFPKHMEFALGNACNFACIQCCGDWSSRIRTQREGMPPLQPCYGDRFFDDLREFIPHLEVAKFFGGEPFLMLENYRIWDLMIEARVRTRGYVLTNGSLWNARIERVLDHLDLTVCVSLDAVADPQLLERIRVGARHDLLLANIQRFRDHARTRNHRLGISFSLMRQNWIELLPMLQYCEANDFDIEVIRVVDPPQFSLFSLPADEMQRIADALDALDPSGLSRLRGTWDDVMRSLRANTRSEQGDGYRHMKEVDRALRNSPAEAAGELLLRGDCAGALRVAGKTARTDKDYVHALVIMAQAHRRLGQLDDAQARLDEALTLTRRLASVFVERAWLRFEQRRFDEAAREAREALATVHDDENGRRQRGHALHVLTSSVAFSFLVTETIAAADQWCSLAGDDPEVLLECGRLLAVVGCQHAALQRLRQALQSPGIKPESRDACLALVDRTSEEQARQLVPAFAAAEAAPAAAP